MASSNLSKVVFQISKSGYKYYTSHSLLNLLFKFIPWFGWVLCDVHCGSPESCSAACIAEENIFQGMAESGTFCTLITIQNLHQSPHSTESSKEDS